MAIGRFLARLQTLERISGADEQRVLALPWSTSRVARGRDILRVGDRPDYVYVIESGWAARYGIRSDGSRRITGFMLPGDFCGIHAVTDAAMDHAITAITECTVARIPIALVEPAVAASPAIGRALWRAKLIDEAILRVWLLNSADAFQAVAHLICELHARAGAGAAPIDGHFLLPITQEQIGDALGITSVHTNRMLKQLRTRGLVAIRKTEVAIPDIAALRAACAFSPAYLHLRSADAPPGWIGGWAPES